MEDYKMSKFINKIKHDGLTVILSALVGAGAMYFVKSEFQTPYETEVLEKVIDCNVRMFEGGIDDYEKKVGYKIKPVKSDLGEEIFIMDPNTLSLKADNRLHLGWIVNRNVEAILNSEVIYLKNDKCPKGVYLVHGLPVARDYENENRIK